ncbi:hypothetical protein [Malikia spinosa]|uniref:hypothetical protein n=1 Tax=Malikia spinosa TaxID=86180 RepID=UPI002FDB6381
MTTYSSNLLIPYLDDNMDNPHLPVNEALRVLDKAIGSKVALAVTGGTTIITDEESRGAYLELTGVLTSNLILQVPARAKQWLVQNKTTGSYTVTVKTATGAGMVVTNDSQLHMVYCDALDCWPVQNSTHGRNRVVLPYGSGITINWAGVDIYDTTLTGNMVISAFTGATDGQLCAMQVRQDATGSRTVGWPPEVRYGTDLTTILLTTTASKMDRVVFQYDAGAGKYDLVSLMRGY